MAIPALAQSGPSSFADRSERLRSGALGNLFRAIRSNPKAMAGLFVLAVFSFMACFPAVIAPDNPSADIYMVGQGPSAQHLLGTTSYGQDIFSQLIWGARASLLIAVIAGLFATVLSVLIGVSAAYLGGFADDFLSLFTDVFLVIPTFPLIIVIVAYAHNGGNIVLVSVLVATGWSYGARQLRSQTLSLRNRDFLVAARLRGERRFHIIIHEVLPTMTSLIVANFLGAALYAVLAAAGLQFIGLGNVDSQSWGTMLYWAQNNEALQSGSPLWATMPGVCIAMLGGAFALLNYAFDEIGNPALRQGRGSRGRRHSS